MNSIYRFIDTLNRLRLPTASTLLFLGGLLWVNSFWLPVFHTPQGTIQGYWVFLIGWMGFAVLHFSWYSNLLMVIAIAYMYRAPVWAMLTASMSLLLATQCLWLSSIPSESISIPVDHYGFGFWIWFISLFAMAGGVMVGADSNVSNSQLIQKVAQKRINHQAAPHSQADLV